MGTVNDELTALGGVYDIASGAFGHGPSTGFPILIENYPVRDVLRLLRVEKGIDMAGRLCIRTAPIVIIGSFTALMASHAYPSDSNAKPTFSKEVSRIMQRKCQSCHRADGVAPFSLLSYDQVKAKAKTIRAAVESRRMPPWLADPKYGKFENDRSLSAEERSALLSWLDSGAPRGDDKELPQPLKFPEKWSIGKPDLVVEMPEEYTVPAEGVLPYKKFVVDPGFNEDRYVQFAEARAGSKAVHHILVYITTSDKPIFDMMGNTQILCGTAPGDSPTILPPEVGVKIPKGAKLLFEIHYTPTGKVERDRSSIGMIFSKQPPKYVANTNVMAKLNIKIPANDPDHEEQLTYAFPMDIRILSVMPHMHFRGKSFEYRIIQPDGKSETILSVPRYDFNWQSIYRFKEPIRLGKGTKLLCIARWDNSKNNPANPDPSKTVTWGEQTWDEMMSGWLGYVVDDSRTAQKP